MNLPRAAAGVLWSALLAIPAGAADPGKGAGTTAVPILQVPLWARAAGMGTAFTAVASDSSSLFYNPAGLARLNAHELGFSFASGLGEIKMQGAAYSAPLPFTGISGNGYSSLGGSLLLSKSGTIEINRLNANGTLGSTETRDAGSDLVAQLAYAERVGMMSISVGEQQYQLDHYAGIGGKFVRSTLVETYKATAFAADAGYLVNCPESGTSFGVSALNMGGKLKYDEQADPLPRTLRSGFAWQGGVPSIHYVLAAVDGDYVLDERAWHANVGLEYFWVKMYGARIGYQINREDAGLTAGLGLRWRGRLLIDYAWGLGRLANSHRITVSLRFGGVPPSQRSRQRRPFIEARPERERIEDIEERRPQYVDPPPRPRSVPRERGQGVPGWIY